MQVKLSQHHWWHNVDYLKKKKKFDPSFVFFCFFKKMKQKIEVTEKHWK